MPSHSPSRRPARKPARACLLLETLEDRTVPSASALAASYGQLRLAFEANQGQAPASVDYLAHGSGYTLALAADQAVLSLGQGTGGATLGVSLVGAKPAAPAVASDPLITRSNYLVGSDPSQWHTNIPNFGQVTYRGVYPGIDLVYHGNQGQLEYDFNVAPGADPGAITLAVQGATGMALDGQGDLVLHTAAGDVLEQVPVVYQDSGGVRQAVSGSFVLEGNGQVGFQVGPYDHSRALVIDPTLTYSSYLSGGGYGIAVDSTGDAYVTGVSSSGAFVSEVNPAGTALIYTTYLGTSGDVGLAIAVDGAGDAYLMGRLASTGFPTTANAVFPTTSATRNDFMAVLNPTGSGLVYSTFLPGGWVYDGRAGAIALDGAGNAYVTGGAIAGFPTTPNAFQSASAAPSGQPNAFLAEINPSLSGSASLVYSTYLGGSGSLGDWGTGVAVDGAGNVYVAGDGTSSNFPTTANAFQQNYANGGSGGFAVGDAFVAKFNPSLSGPASLVYSTYLGGGDGYVSDIGPIWVVLNDNGEKDGPAIAVDASGNAYVAGATNSSNFPTTPGAFQTTYHPGVPGTKKNPGTPNTADAFVTKLNPAGSGLVYSTFLGGSNMDGATGIAVDAQGNAYVTGYTRSTDFPRLNPLQSQKGSGNDGWNNPNSDVFVATLNASGSALLFSTYLGGSGDDFGDAIAVNSAGDAYVTGKGGNPGSSNFPTTPGAFQTAPGGGFVFMIDPPVESSSAPTASPALLPTAPPPAPATAPPPTSAPVAPPARTTGRHRHYRSAAARHSRREVLDGLFADSDLSWFSALPKKTQP